MRARHYIYDSDRAADHVDAVLERLAAREESVDRLDVAAAADRDDAIREAMLAVRESIRIGSSPDEIYDEGGDPDFSVGVLITQEPTGRRHLYTGRAALEALSEAAADESDDA